MGTNTKNQASINSIIGDGTRFRGDLDLQGLLRIDGDFEGSIQTTGRVLVGKTGRARCAVKADTVVAGGIIKGDIQASTKVVLLSTCVMIGNIRTPVLIVEDGVLLHGSCVVADQSAQKITAAQPVEKDLYSVDWNKQPAAAPEV